MIVFKFLFYIRGTQIAVYSERSSQFECRERDGQPFQEMTDAFWSWWQETTAFFPKKNKIDFCFLTDTPGDDFHIPAAYESITETCWNKSNISNFLQSLSPEKFIVRENNAPFYEQHTTDKPVILYLIRHAVPAIESSAKIEQHSSNHSEESQLHKDMKKKNEKLIKRIKQM